MQSLDQQAEELVCCLSRTHRCAHSQGPDGKWNKFGGRLAWDASAICCNNASFGGKGNPKSGDDYVAAPNIDHSKDFVRKVRVFPG